LSVTPSEPTVKNSKQPNLVLNVIGRKALLFNKRSVSVKVVGQWPGPPVYGNNGWMTHPLSIVCDPDYAASNGPKCRVHGLVMR
jgi:hypothetical protein